MSISDDELQFQDVAGDEMWRCGSLLPHRTNQPALTLASLLSQQIITACTGMRSLKLFIQTFAASKHQTQLAVSAHDLM
jgi:hypothetical protein